MKKLLLFVAVLMIVFVANSQTKKDNLLYQIKWNENIVQKKNYSSIATSITSYCFLDDNTIAMLVADEQKIITYSISRNSVLKTIDIPDGGLDFDYYQDKFYVLDNNELYIINNAGQIEQEISYRQPESRPFAVEKFRVIDGKKIINIADGTAWELSENGLVLLDDYYWQYANGFKGRTEKQGFRSFELSINNSNESIKKTIQISSFGLTDDLATVRIMSIDNNQITLDIETSTDNENEQPERFIIITDLQGSFISKIEIPFVYSTYIQSPFVKYKTGLVYCLTALDGLYFYEINTEKNSISLPVGCPLKYHFNDFIEIIDTDELPYQNKNLNKSMLSGSNCVTRTQVYRNALNFRDLTWTATSSNIQSSCGTISGLYFKTPTWVTVGSQTSVPYKWGGWTDWDAFSDYADQGKYAGNYATTDASSPCPQNPYASSSDTYVIGDDCSGFVSRCWETSSKYSTTGLPGISTNLGSATTSSIFSQLQPGDAINKSGSHVRLCLSQNPSGTGSFMEASAVDWKVNNRSYSYTALTGYNCLKYNDINDARLNLAQAISISPTTVVQLQPLTVTYKIINAGSESWSGYVRLYIIQSDGNEMSLQTSSLITLSAGASSTTFSFTSSSVSSPTGTTQLEVRVKNSNTCDYQRYYKVGQGSWTNPLIFTINPPTAIDPCTSITSIGNCGSGYSKTYTGGGSGAWFTSTNNPCGYTTPGIEKIYSFVAPTTGTYSIEVTAASGYVDYLWKSGSCSSSGWNCIQDISSTGTFGSMSWTAGTTYYILLDDENSTTGTHTFYINCPCTVPGSVSVSGGGTYCNSTTLNASGGSGGTIYWQGTTSGGTSTSTASTSQTVTSSGTYYFRAYNSCGWGTQGSATVTINTTPASVSVSGGGTYCNSATLTASGGSGGTIYWQGTTSGGTSTSTASNSQTVSSSGTYYFRANNACGWGAQGSATVTINTIPSSVSVSGGGTYCNSATLTASGGSGGTIYWQGTTSGGTSTANPGNTAVPTSSGTYYFRANNACGWGTQGNATVTINTTPTQPSAISGTSPVCQETSGNYYSVTNVSGVTYTWNVPGGSIISGQGTNTINVYWTTSGTNVITVTPSNSCGNGTSRSYSVNVLPLPSTVSVTGGGTQCNSATLTASASVGTIYWQGTTSNGTSTSTPSTSQTVTSSGTYYFRAYNACGWGAQGSATVTINTTPASVSVSGGGTFCNSATLTASGGSGGTIYWQGTTSGGTSTSTASSSQTVTSSGTYYFRSYNSCGWGTQGSATVTINSTPSSVSVSGGGTYCNSATLTASGGSGGTIYWQGATSGGTSTTNSTNPQTVTTSGTYYFRAYNSCGWGTQGSATVTINTTPSEVTVSGGGTFCNSATLSAGGGSGGTIYWQGNTSGGTSTTNSTNPQTVTSSGTYYFRSYNSCGWGTQGSATVIINPVPTSPILGTITQPTCTVTTGGVVLNGLPATGTWTLTRTPGGTITSGTGTSSTITGLTAGTYTYTVTNSSGCTSLASANIVINAQPTTPTAPTIGTITQPSCTTATGNVVLNGLPSSGTWTLTRTPGGTITTGTGTSTTITSLVGGTYTFTVTNASGCTSVSSANVVINAQPTIPSAPTVGAITQPTCAIATGSVILSGLPSTGTWTLTLTPGGTATTGTGTSTTISGLAAGTYTYTVTNSSGCTSIASSNVVINTFSGTPNAPILGTITQPTCTESNGSVVLNGLPTTGTWTLTVTPGGTTTTGIGTSTTITGLAAGIYSYTVTNSSGCTSVASANVIINVQPIIPTAPTIGTITQPTCTVATGGVVLNGLPATGTWTLTRSPGGTITNGTGASSTITGLTAGTYTYTVTNSSGCTSLASANIIINSQPTTPIAPTIGLITQPSCTTATGNVVLNGLPSSGTWTLTKTPGGTITTGTGTNTTITGLASGTYTFTVTNSYGCTSVASANVVINAQPAPTVSVITTNTSCSGNTGTATANVSNGTPLYTYLWSDGQTTQTATGLGAGSYSVTVTDGNGCIVSSSVNINFPSTYISQTTDTVIIDLFFEQKSINGNNFVFFIDYNNDGKTDMLTRENSSGKIFSYRNTGTTYIIEDTLNANAYSYSANPSSKFYTNLCQFYTDMDNDGNNDLVIYSANHSNCSSNSVRVYWGNASFPYFSDAIYTNITLNYAFCVGAYAVDFDNDGLKDIFVRTAGTGAETMSKNNGNRSFSTVTTINTGRDIGVNFDDYDGDGFADLCYTKNGWADSQWGIRFNKGLGTGDFNASTIINYSAQRPVDDFVRFAADPLSDTVPDILFNCSNDGTNGGNFYWGEWSQTLNNFTFDTIITGNNTESTLIQAIDYNSDGYEDVIMRYKTGTNPYYYTTIAYLNDGFGNFNTNDTIIKNAPYSTFQLFKDGNGLKLAAYGNPDTLYVFSVTQIHGGIPTDGLVAHYPFNGNANDESGNALHGIVHNNVVLTTDRNGNPNSAYYFTGGTYDWIEVANNPLLNLGPDFTVSAWVVKTGTNGIIINKGRDISCGTWGLSTNTIGINGTCGTNTGTSVDVTLNEWHMVTGVLDGNNGKLRFYQDAQLIAEVVTNSFTANNNYPIAIGRHCTDQACGSAWPYPFMGKIDDIIIYNRTLNQSEINQLYQSTSAPSVPIGISLGNDTTICSNQTIALDAGAGFNNYHWSTNENTQSISVSNLNAGIHQYTVTVTACGSTAADTINVNISPTPDSAGIITGITTVCSGQNAVTYTVPSIVNATSYVWTLPGGATGTSNTNSITVDYSDTAVSGNITVKGNNSCGDGAISALTIAVNGYIISGKTLYMGKANAGNPIPNQPTYNSAIYNLDKVIVILKNQYLGTEIARDTSDASGAYEFRCITDGNYTLSYDKYTSDTMQWGNNVNAVDLALLKYLIGHDTLTDPSRSFAAKHKRAANIDNNTTINTIDIARIASKVGLPYTPARNFPRGNWVALDTSVTVAGSNLNITLKTICYGDYDASSTKYKDSTLTWSMAKSLPDENIILRSDESVTTNNNGYFEVPLRINAKMNEFSAMGLELSYPSEQYKLVSASMPNTGKKSDAIKINPTLEEIIAANNDLLVTDIDGVIRVVFATTDHFDIAANVELVRLGFRSLNDPGRGELDFNLSGTGLIANQYGEINEDAYLTMPKIFVQGDELEAGFEFAGYPNPFSGDATLTYSIPENGTVKLSVYNAIGELVTLLVNETQIIGTHSAVFSPLNLPAGMYTFKLEFTGSDKSKCIVLKMIH